MIRGVPALKWKDGLKALIAEGIEAIVFRTSGDQPSLWESLLPEAVRRLPEELARVDALLNDPAFFAPFVPFFDERMVMRLIEFPQVCSLKFPTCGRLSA